MRVEALTLQSSGEIGGTYAMSNKRQVQAKFERF